MFLFEIHVIDFEHPALKRNEGNKSRVFQEFKTLLDSRKGSF